MVSVQCYPILTEGVIIIITGILFIKQGFLKRNELSGAASSLILAGQYQTFKVTA